MILSILLHIIVVLCTETVNVLGRTAFVDLETRQCMSCNSPDVFETQGAIFGEMSVKKEGDIMIGGLVPIKYKYKDGIRFHNVALVEAMIWAVDEINRDPHILPNFTLGYEIRDTMSDGAFASVQALELAAKNVIGIVGPGSSKVAVHLASLLGSLGYPMISYAATSNLLSNTDRFTMFARTVPSDAYQCSAIKDLISYYDWSYVSILYSPELYGMDGAELIRHMLEEEGSCIDQYIQLKQHEKEHEGTMYAMEVLNKTLSKPTNHTNKLPAHVIVLFTTFPYAKQIIAGARLLKEQGFKNGLVWDNITWIAPESWSKKTILIRQIAEYGLGNFIGVSPKTFPLPHFGEYYKTVSPLNRTVSSITTKHSLHNPWFDMYYSYCNGTIEDCGKFSYTKQGAYEEPIVLAVEVLAQTLHELLGTKYNVTTLDPCLKPASPINNSENLYYLRNSVVGQCLFGKLIKNKYKNEGKYRRKSLTRDLISFNDTNGDFEAIYTFVTYNFTADMEIVLLDFGEWNKTHKQHVFNATLPFREGIVHKSICALDCQPGFRRIQETKMCCWVCEPCPIDHHSEMVNSKVCLPCRNGTMSNQGNTGCDVIFPTYLNYTHPAALVLMFLSSLGALLTLFTLVVFIKHADTPIVKASSKELCVLMLCGVFTGFLSSLLSLGRPTDSMCMVHLCLGTMFGSLTIIPLFLKVARVFSLFYQSKTKRKNGKPPQYLLPVWQSVICIVLVGVQVVILGVVSIFFPLRAKEKFPDRSTVYIACEGKDSLDTTMALGLPVGYVLFFMILSTIMSYRVRKLPSNFQEAKYICLAQIIAIIVLTAFIPAYFTSRGVWQTFSVGIASQICASSILILIFFKKVNIILLYPERNKVVLTKNVLKDIVMSRDDRRKSYLKSEHCHMCGHMLGAGMSYKALPGGKVQVYCKLDTEEDSHFKVDTALPSSRSAAVSLNYRLSKGKTEDHGFEYTEESDKQECSADTTRLGL